jgi:hypothetical protein
VPTGSRRRSIGIIRRHDPLLPPAHLRIYYYGTWDPRALRAPASIRTELISRGLRP